MRRRRRVINHFPSSAFVLGRGNDIGAGGGGLLHRGMMTEQTPYIIRHDACLSRRAILVASFEIRRHGTSCLTTATQNAPANMRNGVSQVCGETASDRVMAIGIKASAVHS